MGLLSGKPLERDGRSKVRRKVRSSILMGNGLRISFGWIVDQEVLSKGIFSNSLYSCAGQKCKSCIQKGSGG